MSFKTYEKVELAFWDAIIYMLDEIKPVRLVVQKTYHSFENGALKQLASASLVAAMAGFLSGISLFLIATLLK